MVKVFACETGDDGCECQLADAEEEGEDVFEDHGDGLVVA